MRRLRLFLAPVWLNPVARCVAALVLFAASLGGLTLTAYGDQLENGGVSYNAPAEPVPYTAVNPLGVNTFLEKEVDPANVVRSLDMIRDGGFKWIRQGFAWNDIEISAKGNYTDTRNPGNIRLSWDKYDFIVNEAVSHNINIIARLDSPPVWARSPGDDVEAFRKGPPAHNEDYADFVRAVVARYKGKIKYFQIWNEPNLYGEWGGFQPDPAAYTQLLKAAYEAVKSVDPQAVVISAALAPTAGEGLKATNDVLFLEGMYRAGAAPYFDILSTMLYGLGQPPDERRTDLDRLNFSRPILLHQVMERNGDARKAIWISEYAWLSLPPDWEAGCAQIAAKIARHEEDPSNACGGNIWGRSVDEETQARWEVEGYERVQREWPWMGVMSVWYFREPAPNPKEPANFFAIVRPDFTPRPAYYALKEYSATLNPAQRPTAQKPLWNALGFPFLYAVFGLLTLASAGWGAGSMGRWAGAALNMPRGRYRETARELARNGSVVVGMALLAGLYYMAGSVPLMLVALGLWGMLAFLKPSTGLAAVAFAVPFYWQPKVIGPNRFPIAETLLLLVFGAVVARHTVRRFLPALAARLRIYEAYIGQTELELERRGYIGEQGAAEWPEPGSPGPEPLTVPGLNGRAGRVAMKFPPLVAMPRTTDPLDDLEPSEELDAAEWPSRPRPVRYRYFPQPLPRAAYVPSSPAPARTERPVIKATRPLTLEQDRPTIQEGLPEQLPDLDAGPIYKRPNLSGRIAHPATTFELLRARFLAWNQDDIFAAPGVAMLILGLLSLLTLADPAFAPDSARAFRWTIIEPVLFYFLLTDVIKNRRSLLRVADFFVAAAVIVALYGIWQFIQDTNVLDVEGVSRISSVYEHPNNLALYLGRVAPLAACLAIFLPWGWRKLIYMAVTLPLAATLLLTYSRGAWVAVTVAMGAALFVGFRWRQGRVTAWRMTRRAWVITGGVCVLLVVAGIVVYPLLPERVKTIGSGVLRIELWKSAAQMIADHPLTGIGPDQFLNQFQSKVMVNGEPLVVAGKPVYRYMTAAQAQESFTAHPHNIILDYWLTLGIMSVFVLLWLLWRYFREAVNRVKVFSSKAGADPVGKALALGLLASMIDFLVHGTVDNSYFLMDLALTFWLSCGLMQVARRT